MPAALPGLRCDFREPNVIRAAANVPLPYLCLKYGSALSLLGRSFWLFEIAEVIKIPEEFFLFFENVNDV
jgi:hypothetical protein